MNVKTLIATAAASVALGTMAEEPSYTSPYTITVAKGVEQYFSNEDLAALASGNYDALVKEGEGTLHATNCTALANFAGIIHVKEGVWYVTENGDGGFFGTTAGATWVKNGAAIHVQAPSPENKCKFQGEHFYMEGTGPDGKGVVYNSSGCDELQLFNSYCKVDLTGDALIQSRYAINVWYYSTLNLNGHHLTYRSYDTGGVRMFGFTTSPFAFGASDVLTINHARLGFDPNSVMSAFGVTAGAKLILTNSAAFYMRNNVPYNQDVKPLAMDVDNATIWPEYANASQPYAGNWGTNANSYGGPVKLMHTVAVQGVGNGSPLTLGQVSGSGTLNVTQSRLQMIGKDNTYTGDIVVDGTGASIDKCGFRLWRGASMTPAKSLTFKNAQLVLSDNDAVALPPVTVNGAAQFIGGPATNPAVRSVAASVTKTGDGELYWDSALDVTGRTEVAAGVLRLAKPKVGNPGLGEANVQSEGGKPFNYYYNNGAKSWNQKALDYCRTIRREGPAAAFSRAEWRYYTCAYYHGYVWNRTDTDVTWDIASVLGSYAYLYIDGARIDGVTSGPGGMSAQGGAASYPITLTPGAHEVAFYFVDQKTRSDAQSKSIPGPTIGWYNEWWPWVDRGIAYDPEGTSGGVKQTWSTADGKAYAKAHFVPFKDPGDGSLFTVDDKTTAEIDQRGYHPGFSNLVVKAGAAIDLSGNDLAVGRIGMGTGVISNGTLTVKAGFAFSSADPGDGPTVKGPVVFADGATVEIDETTRMHRGTYVLLTAEGGMTGSVTVDRERYPNWSVQKAGNRLELSYGRRVVILIR